MVLATHGLFLLLLDILALNFWFPSLLDNLNNKKLLKAKHINFTTIVWKLYFEWNVCRALWDNHTWKLRTWTFKSFFATHIKTISTWRQNRVCLLLLFDKIRWQLFGLFKAWLKGERTLFARFKLIYFMNQVVGYKH